MPPYFDYAATTPVCPAAAQAALSAMTEHFFNPSSVYAPARAAARQVEDDRAAVARALGCAPDELVFTSCGTEGNNWAIRAALRLNRRRGRHIITTAIEHAAVLETVKDLSAQGFEVTCLRPDREGHIHPEDLRAALREDTALVSVMLVNNELGTVQDVARCAQIAKAFSSQILFHCDAVQGFLKVPFSPAALGVDLLSISGHKVGAPKGIGALYIRGGLRLPPLLTGGGQERGLRSGTEPTAQIAAFAAACRAWEEHREDYARRTRALKNYALSSLTAALPALKVVSAGEAPHICAVSLPGYPSEMLVRALSDEGIYVSSGSACHRGRPSHVFAALGLPKQELMGVLRLSFSHENTREEIDALTAALVRIAGERVGR